MKTLWITAFVGLSLLGAMHSASAQRGDRDYGHAERNDDYDEREYSGRDRGDDQSRGDNDNDDDEDQRRERGRSDETDRGSERGRGYDDDRDRQRGRGYEDGGRGRERGRGYREEREVEFDEDEYLRCNPDVRRAVERGEIESGKVHYRTFGRRERRRLTCPLRV